ALLADAEGAAAPCRRIAIIAHSRGGLLSSRYLVDSLGPTGSDPHRRIARQRIRFLGTLNSPHHGSSLAAIPQQLHDIAAELRAYDLGVFADLIDNNIQSLVEVVEGVSEDTLRDLSPLGDFLVRLNAA